MATKSFYLKDAVAGSSQYGSLQEGTSPTISAAAGASATGWIVAKLAASRYALMDYGTELTSAAFATTDPLSTTSLNNTTGNAWRSENAYTGDFASGNWTFALTFRTTSAGAIGRCRAQLWKGANADGSGATRIGSASAAAAGQTFGTLSTFTFTSTVNPGAQTFTNEYLFVQVEWEITGTASSNANNVRFYIAGTGTTAALVTADFTAVIAYTTPITAGTVGIVGQNVLLAVGQTEAITAGTVGIVGQTVVPAFGRTDVITAGAVDIVGQTIVPVFDRTDAIVADTVGIVGQTVTPVFGGGATDYTTPITAGTVDIVGQTVTPTFASSGLDLDFTSGTLDSRVTFARTSVATYFNSSGVLSSAASGVPRLDYDPVTLLLRGLLIEEQRSNFLTYSQAYSGTTWVVGNGISLIGTVTAPDGTSTATTVTVASGSEPALYQSVSFPGGTCTLSFWAKSSASGGATKIRVATNNTSAWNTGMGAKFALTSIWQRFTLTGIPSNTGAANVGIIDLRDYTTGTIDPDTALLGNVDIWGAQFEVGDSPTSYIPTTNIGLTRAADAVSMTGTDFSSWYNQTEGTIVLDCVPPPPPPGSSHGWVSLSDGTNDNRIVMAAEGGGGGTVGFAVLNGGGVQMNAPSANIYTNYSLTKAGYAVKQDDTAACLNGGTVLLDTVLDNPTALTRLDFGKGSLAANIAPQLWLRRFQFFPVRKSDADLQALTSLTGAVVEVITAGTVPITGQTVAPVFAIAEPAITAGTVGIVGQTVVPVFGRTDAITAGAVPIVGQTITPVFAITEPVITTGTVPITGQNVTPVFGRTDAITAGTVPIVGQTVSSAFGRVDTITAGAVPIVGQTVTPVFGRVDTITAGAVPIVGQTVTPVFSGGGINYSDTITAGTVAITGQTIVDVFAQFETIFPDSVPIIGQIVLSAYGHPYSITITAGAVTIVGQAVADAFGRVDAITAGTVPITGQNVNEFTTLAYVETITADTVPITGQAVFPYLAQQYSDTITAGLVTIGGQNVNPFYTQGSINYQTTVTAGVVPIAGANVVPVYAQAVNISGGPPVTLRGSISAVDTLEGAVATTVGLRGSVQANADLEGSFA